MWVKLTQSLLVRFMWVKLTQSLLVRFMWVKLTQSLLVRFLWVRCWVDNPQGCWVRFTARS